MKMAVTICVLFLTVLMATVSNADVSLFGSAGSFGLNPVQGLSSDGPFRMQVPSFPPLPWPNNIQFPKFPKFPTFPPINTIKPLTFESIAAQGGQPGNNFNGIAVLSHAETKKSKDGEVGKTGGATVVFNDNGKITVHQTGDAPPPISIIKDAPFADFQQPEFDEFDFIHDNIKKPDFNIPKFDSFTFKPLDMERIKSYVPESNEKFKGSGYTYNSYSSNLNGVKKGGATFATVNNDNGKVVEKQIDLHNGPH